MEKQVDRVTAVFVGKHILITGGTGFIGKVLIEKILRHCPEVGCIYLLMRPKKGKDPQTRIIELLENPLFDKLKSIHGADLASKKCRIIKGDVSQVDLGISAEDRKLLTGKIDYIYHMAATVRFDEPLKSALLMNTRGTKFMLALAKECKNLQMFCYVSTAYMNPSEKLLEEKAYPTQLDPHQMIQNMENMTSDEVDVITPKLLGNSTNVYGLTKHLSEALVVEQMDNLPVYIVRPSIVIPMWKEPLPGWGENINGPVGILIGAGKGVVRSVYCESEFYADFIPVDGAINAICISTWDYVTNKNINRRFFNFTSSDEIRYTWQDILNEGKKIVTTEIPFNYVAWYPGGTLKKSKINHYVCTILFQIIPAIFADALLLCLGQKPVLIKVQKRIWKGSKLLEFYTSQLWNFVKDNGYAVRKLLTKTELEKYYVGASDFVFEDYLRNAVLGARRYVMKEPDSTIPAAKRHLMIMWMVDILFKVGAVGVFIYYCMKLVY